MQGNEKKRRVRAGSFIVIVFLLLYVPSLLHWVYGKNIATDIIRMGVIEDSINTSGCIIRDSVLFRPPFEGKYIPAAEEGERVAAGERIATVLKASSVNLLKLLEEKKLKIIKAQNEKTDNSKIFSEDIVKLEDEIGKRIKMVVDESNINSMLGMKKISEGIYELVQKKAAVAGGIPTSDAYINTLKKERDQIQEQINASTADVVSETPGVVSYVVDEYEEVLTPKAIDKLSPENLDNIKAAENIGGLRQMDASADKPLVKVVKGNCYYIAVALGAQDAELFEEGDVIRVRINDIQKETSSKIIYKSEEKEGRYVIVLEVDRFMSETACLRKVNIDLIRNFHEGLMVPVGSLINVDVKKSRAQIILVKANCASIRDVVIEGKSGEYAVIRNPNPTGENGVSLYDTYIVKPDNIEEGQIIGR